MCLISLINGVGYVNTLWQCNPASARHVNGHYPYDAEDIVFDIKIILMTQSRLLLVESRKRIISIVPFEPEPLIPVLLGCSSIPQRLSAEYRQAIYCHFGCSDAISAPLLP